MAAHNRHIRGKTNERLVPVRGNVVVEAGDFMYIDTVGGVRGTTIAVDRYADPFNLAVNSSSSQSSIMHEIYENFLGVAMESSPSGTTEDISIASSGIFSYPLSNATGSAVTVGALISAVSPSATGTAVSAQAVVNSITQPGSTAYLGYCIKTESGASYVDFQLITASSSRGKRVT